jgi:hypothetical protein
MFEEQRKGRSTMKKRITIRLDPRRLANERIKLVIDRKPDDTIRANGSDVVGTGHDRRGRGLEPVGRAVWRVINGARK